MIKHFVGMLGIFAFIFSTFYFKYLIWANPNLTFNTLWEQHYDEMLYSTVASVVGVMLFIYFSAFRRLDGKS